MHIPMYQYLGYVWFNWREGILIKFVFGSRGGDGKNFKWFIVILASTPNPSNLGGEQNEVYEGFGSPPKNESNTNNLKYTPSPPLHTTYLRVLQIW